MTSLIISIGPRQDSDLLAKIADYQKRLQSRAPIEWQLLPYSGLSGEQARRTESASIAQKINDKDFVVLLDERGSELSSESLADKLSVWQASSRRLVFVIGGAYGVDGQLRDRADFVWSLSRLVFPHQLVRLMLMEQLYRADCINTGHPYHHS